MDYTMVDNLESKIEGIKFTELAAKKALEAAELEKIPGTQGLRLCVKGGGCAGLQYEMYFEDKKSNNDKEFEFYGLKVYVDPFSYQYLIGTEIDYIDGLNGSGFKFNNPRYNPKCGCGSSFTDE